MRNPTLLQRSIKSAGSPSFFHTAEEMHVCFAPLECTAQREEHKGKGKNTGGRFRGGLEGEGSRSIRAPPEEEQELRRARELKQIHPHLREIIITLEREPYHYLLLGYQSVHTIV